MRDIVRDELGAPKIVDRSAFQAELDALRVREKAHTKEGDAIAAARRRLPMVEVTSPTPRFAKAHTKRAPGTGFPDELGSPARSELKQRTMEMHRNDLRHERLS